MTQPKIYYTATPDATPPKRGRENDIAHDMYTSKDAWLLPDRQSATIVPSGIKTAFDPTEYGLFISPRSGMSKYPITLANCTGLIEGEYRGDVGFPLRNINHFGFCPQSTAILTIKDDGTPISVDADAFFAAQPESVYEDYREELEKLIEDVDMVFNGQIRNFGDAIRGKDVNGKIGVPSGTMYLPKGVRIAQAYLVPRQDTLWEEVDSLPESVRGEDGYGSSGAF